jgi:hypothetical protein
MKTKLKRCGEQIKIIAAILNEDARRRILNHLNLPSQIPDFAPPRPGY